MRREALKHRCRFLIAGHTLRQLAKSQPAGWTALQLNVHGGAGKKGKWKKAPRNSKCKYNTPNEISNECGRFCYRLAADI